MKTICLILASLLLTACVEPQVINNPIIIPSQRAIIETPILTLLPVKVDAPRNADGKIDYANSNLYRGYDKDNWDNVQINDVRKDEYIKSLLKLIDLSNATTTKNNDEAQKKLDSLKEAPK